MKNAIVIRESDIRRAIRKTLSEASDSQWDRIHQSQMKDISKSVAASKAKIAAVKESILGKKFAYVYKGPHEGVIIAKITSSGPYVAKVYSKATTKDPVAAGKGRLIREDEILKYDAWTFPEWYTTQFDWLRGPVEETLNMAEQIGIPGVLRRLYYTNGLFVLTVDPQRPTFTGTEKSVEQAQKGECSFSIRDFNAEYKRLDDLEGEEAHLQKLRLVACFKSWTQDSILYAIAQFIVSSLATAAVSVVATPAGGAVAGIATDAVLDGMPGFFIAGFYAGAGKRQKALEAILVTLILILTPVLLKKFVKGTWKTLLASLGVGVIVLIINKVTKMMFGDDFGFTAAEANEYFNSLPDESVESFTRSRAVLKGNEQTDTVALMRKLYPAL